jgi:hypothetical protein
MFLKRLYSTFKKSGAKPPGKNPVRKPLRKYRETPSGGFGSETPVPLDLFPKGGKKWIKN